jgi:hypothetical protein
MSKPADRNISAAIYFGENVCRREHPWFMNEIGRLDLAAPCQPIVASRNDFVRFVEQTFKPSALRSSPAK